MSYEIIGAIQQYRTRDKKIGKQKIRQTFTGKRKKFEINTELRSVETHPSSNRKPQSVKTNGCYIS